MNKKRTILVSFENDLALDLEYKLKPKYYSVNI
jgi:hypothetical protein